MKKVYSLSIFVSLFLLQTGISVAGLSGATKNAPPPPQPKAVDPSTATATATEPKSGKGMLDDDRNDLLQSVSCEKRRLIAKEIEKKKKSGTKEDAQAIKDLEEESRRLSQATKNGFCDLGTR